MNDIEKAIELFKNHDTVTFKVTGCGEESYKTIEFEEAIQLLEKQLNGGWIPVRERLPEEDEEVLITLAHGCVCWAFIYLNEWNTATTSYPIECAIAWMPLPEPYKEVEQ